MDTEEIFLDHDCDLVGRRGPTRPRDCAHVPRPTRSAILEWGRATPKANPKNSPATSVIPLVEVLTLTAGLDTRSATIRRPRCGRTGRPAR